jgi:hypothetical protein
MPTVLTPVVSCLLHFYTALLKSVSLYVFFAEHNRLEVVIKEGWGRSRTLLLSTLSYA